MYVVIVIDISSDCKKHEATLIVYNGITGQNIKDDQS